MDGGLARETRPDDGNVPIGALADDLRRCIARAGALGLSEIAGHLERALDRLDTLQSDRV